MRRLYACSLGAVISGLAVLFVELAIHPARALAAYTAAYGFGVTIALGALLVVVIMHTARASWFVVLRRPADAIASTLPLFLVLFIPIAVGLRGIYPWMHPDAYPEAIRETLHHDHWLLNPAFFVVRAYGYLTIWAALGWFLRRLSLRQDVSPEYELTAAQRWISSASIPVLAVTLSLAGFDWLMSLVPGFYSDMFGFYFFAGAFYGALGAIVIACALAHRAGVLPRAVGPAHFSALGRVILVSTILWAYIAYAQLLLIWIANLPREVIFYVQRIEGGWAFFTGVLIFGHFAAAFLLLLSRPLKLNSSVLAWVGAFVVLMHADDHYWLAVPSSGQPRVLDCGAFLFVAGSMTAFAAWRFSRALPVPVNDPYLPRSLAYESP